MKSAESCAKKTYLLSLGLSGLWLLLFMKKPEYFWQYLKGWKGHRHWRCQKAKGNIKKPDKDPVADNIKNVDKDKWTLTLLLIEIDTDAVTSIDIDTESDTIR